VAQTVPFSNGLGLKKWVVICRSSSLNRAGGSGRASPGGNANASTSSSGARESRACGRRRTLAVASSDYSPYCVTTPPDSRLPGGGGQQICGLFDLNPLAPDGRVLVGRSNSLGTAGSNYGGQFEHWNGFDFSMNARLRACCCCKGA
jgi:hypothetical protein